MPAALYGIVSPVGDLIGTDVAGLQHGGPGHYDFGPVRWWPAFIFGHANILACPNGLCKIIFAKDDL